MSYYLTEMGAAGDEATIVLGGDLDMRAAPALRDALVRAIERRAKHLVVDLTNATFADSTPLGALFEASAHVRETGGRLRLICTNANVLRTLEIAGLDRHIVMPLAHPEAREPAARPAKGVRVLNAQGA
jgi:anti-sigma B factor antagonist